MIVADFVFCVLFLFVCLPVVSCVLNVANVSGCPFTIVADLVFPTGLSAMFQNVATLVMTLQCLL